MNPSHRHLKLGATLALLGLLALCAGLWLLQQPGRLAEVWPLLLLLLAAVAPAFWWLRGVTVRLREVSEQEARLRRCEELYRVTLQSIGDGVLVTDADGRIVRLNPVAEGLLGWKLEEARQRPAEEVFRTIHETTRQPLSHPVREVIAQGALVEQTRHTLLLARDGVERPISDSGVPIWDEGRKLAGVVLVFRDQTVERHREQALAESQLRYRSLYNSMTEMVTLHELIRDESGQAVDYRILDVNAAFTRITGIAREDAVGARATVLYGIRPPPYLELYARIALGGEPHQFDTFYAPMERHFSISVFSTGEGQFATVATDITARKRAETQASQQLQETERARKALVNALEDRTRAQETIQRNEAELAAIYDSTPVMLCLVNQKFQVERINRYMAEFIGHPAGQPGLAPPGDIIGCVNALAEPNGCGGGPQCGTCPLRLALADTFATGQSHRQVESPMILLANGRQREIRVSASTAVLRTGGESKVVLSLEDVTTRRQLEVQLLQAQKMDAIGQLAGGIAHDFNNILAAMMLNLELIEATADPSPQLSETLKELERGAQRAASLTRQLLQFSRRQVMQTRRLNLNLIVDELGKMLARLLGEPIHLSFAGAPQPLWIMADPGMIEQIIVNLCVNARDAMPGGGRLNLATCETTLTFEDAKRHPDARAGEFAQLVVSDTGSGMDAATLKRIFEPFFTTKTVGKGTGLGLATAYGIIRQHHGWIEVESAPGQGSSFRVFLPLVSAAPAAEAPEPQTPVKTGGTETILLVEDDERVRGVVRATLQLQGYKVIEAATGVEALRVWDQLGDTVDLLFTDMIMPEGITGLDLALQLRQSKHTLKIIISSGYSSELSGSGETLPAGMRFLPKPYNLKALASTVRQCLDAG